MKYSEGSPPPLSSQHVFETYRMKEGMPSKLERSKICCKLQKVFSGAGAQFTVAHCQASALGKHQLPSKLIHNCHTRSKFLRQSNSRKGTHYSYWAIIKLLKNCESFKFLGKHCKNNNVPRTIPVTGVSDVLWWRVNLISN